jgi:hypothetical protein
LRGITLADEAGLEVLPELLKLIQENEHAARELEGLVIRWRVPKSASKAAKKKSVG